MNQHSNLEERLKRALGHVFGSRGEVVRTMADIFQDYPLDVLEPIGEGEDLDKILTEISMREDVHETHEVIAESIASGEILLNTTVLGLVYRNLEASGIVPKNDQVGVDHFQFREIGAYAPDNKRLVSGYFPPDEETSNVLFTPDRVFYNAGGLTWEFDPGKKIGKPFLRLPQTCTLQKDSLTTVYTTNPNKQGAIDLSSKVISDAVDAKYMTMRNKGQPRPRERDEIVRDVTNKLVTAFHRVFHDVRYEDGQINYPELYRIFEAVRRRNITLDHVSDQPLRENLQREIDRLIPLPYAVISASVKRRERSFEKILEAFYDIPSPGRLGGERSFRDLHRLRIIVPKEGHVYDIADHILRTPGVYIAHDEKGKEMKKDYIKSPKPNGYQGFHMNAIFGGVEYEFQLRTHEMDYEAENNPKQQHDETFLANKRKWMESIPIGVKKVLGASLGFYVPTNLQRISAPR
jgi:hypothetical protein